MTVTTNEPAAIRHCETAGPTNLDAPLEVPSLATSAGLTERSFHRKFVAAQVGLFDPSRLAEAFERRFGVAPRLFRDMHAEL